MTSGARRTFWPGCWPRPTNSPPPAPARLAWLGRLPWASDVGRRPGDGPDPLRGGVPQSDVVQRIEVLRAASSRPDAPVRPSEDTRQERPPEPGPSPSGGLKPEGTHTRESAGGRAEAAVVEELRRLVVATTRRPTTAQAITAATAALVLDAMPRYSISTGAWPMRRSATAAQAIPDLQRAARRAHAEAQLSCAPGAWSGRGCETAGLRHCDTGWMIRHARRRLNPKYRSQCGEIRRVPLRDMRLPGMVPCAWSRLDIPRRLLLGGCLLVLVISGCTIGIAGPCKPTRPGGISERREPTPPGVPSTPGR